MRKSRMRSEEAPQDTGVTSLAAARSQLATAIRLYFAGGDPISTYTLAAAASEIIHQLCKHRGILGLRDQLMQAIPPDRKREVVSALNGAQNFFKHASSNKPDRRLVNFDDEAPLYPLLMAAEGLRVLGEKHIDAALFLWWWSIVEPGKVIGPRPGEVVRRQFGDIADRPRNVQKQAALKVLLAIHRHRRQ
jgi:hypothetical protein